MHARRATKTYRWEEVCQNDSPVALLEVHEHHWLLQHSHQFPEIAYIQSGHGLHYVEQTSMPVRQGDLLIIPRGSTHVLRPSPDGQGRLAVCNVMLNPHTLRQWKPLLPDPAVRKLIGWLLDEDGSELAELPRWLHMTNQQQAAALHLESVKTTLSQEAPLYATLLWVHVVALLRLLAVAAFTDSRSEPLSAPSLKEQIRQAISGLAPEQTTVARVAKQLGISERHLSRCFRKQYGETPHSFIQQWRLEQLKAYLHAGQGTVSEALEHFGLRNRDYLNRVFKRHTGKTAAQYLRQGRAES